MISPTNLLVCLLSIVQRVKGYKKGNWLETKVRDGY